SGVDVARFGNGPSLAEAKRALGLDPHRPVVGTVGRLESRKGHEHFLRAARTMLGLANGLRPQVVIVGAGPLRAALAREAARRRVGQRCYARAMAQQLEALYAERLASSA